MCARFSLGVQLGESMRSIKALIGAILEYLN